MACGAVGGQEREALPAAAALELFHTWTLMHDDIIDHDDLRRGGPTGHVVGARSGERTLGLAGEEAQDYGQSLAILAGDVQHGLCVEMFLRCENVPVHILVHLLRQLERRVVCDLVHGETLDIQLGKRPVEEVTLDEVLHMMYLKTAALYEFAGKAGAMIGLGTTDRRHPQVTALREFCRHCGIAFQLQDDILGVTANQEVLGKPVGSDITEGKRTPVLLSAYRVADAETRELLDRVVGNHHATGDEIWQVREKMVAVGAVEEVAALAREHVDKAAVWLQQIPPSPYATWLAGWAEFMVERDT
jgi:geranylgeranyl diphosphate synthase, type I